MKILKVVILTLVISGLTGCSGFNESMDNSSPQANKATIVNAMADNPNNDRPLESESKSQATESNNSHGNSNNSHWNSNRLETIDTSKSQFEKGYYDYAGSINENLPIQMSIYPLEKDMVGSYFYEKQQKEIKLKGKAGANNIILNEYDAAGKVTGIFKGTMNTLDKIEGTWTAPDGQKSYPFKLALKSNLPGVAYGKRYGVSESDQEVEDFLNTIKGYILNNNKERLAAEIIYPFKVKVDGQVVDILSKDDFIKNYDRIFYPDFKKVLNDAFTKYLFANYQGIMFGNGVYNLWLNDATLNGPAKLMIIAINN